MQMITKLMCIQIFNIFGESKSQKNDFQKLKQ
jgi:hypothetical protein